MSATVEADGTVRQLDRRAEPDENITAQNVQSPFMLARYLLRLFRDVATLKRKWMPKHIDFRDIVSTGTGVSPQTVYLDHGLNGPVVWWVVKWSDLGTGSLIPISELTDETTDTRLALSLTFEGTVTIRVEEAG